MESIKDYLDIVTSCLLELFKNFKKANKNIEDNY